MTNGTGSNIVAHFRSGLDVLKKYPVMAVPPLAAQILVFVLTVAFFGGAATAVVVGGVVGLAGAFVGAFFLMVVNGLLSLLAAAVTIVMARDALAVREPSIGDALSAVMARFVDVVIASILVVVIVAGLSVVFFFLLGLPGIVAAFFLVFTLPAVLLDNQGAIEAMKRSVKLVKDNVGSVVGLVIGAIVAAVIVMIISRLLRIVPILGHLAAAILAGAFIAYLTIVAVRVYQTLPRR